MMTTIPVAMTIAGSDSGGGAGIQADLKTFHQHGVFGSTVITAVTAQDTLGVAAIHPVPPEVVEAQITAVVEDLVPRSIKIGMLATAAIAARVCEALGGQPDIPLVLDPVMVSTSGHPLIDDEAQELLTQRLVPRATLVTPNIPEAEALTGIVISDPATMRQAGRAILDLGARAVLVKGAHLPGREILDLLISADGEQEWLHGRLTTRHTHGTGCTLSAAITARLAQGHGLHESVERGIRFLQRAIVTAPGIGRGQGPVNHFAQP